MRAQALTTSHAHSPRHHHSTHPSRHHHTTPTHASGDLSVFSGKDINDLNLYNCAWVTGMTCSGGSIGSAEGPSPHHITRAFTTQTLIIPRTHDNSHSHYTRTQYTRYDGNPTKLYSTRGFELNTSEIDLTHYWSVASVSVFLTDRKRRYDVTISLLL